KYVKRPQVLSWAMTFAAVVLGCLFFMETDIGVLMTKLATLVTPSAYSLGNLIGAFGQFSANELVAMGWVLLLAGAFLLFEHIAVWQERPEYELLLNPWVSRGLLGLTILLSANIPSEFIYFEF
ncbi:MAG: MBOAT family protein, partial [Cyanobacteria bacterium P01_C01_bin.118]